MNVMIQEYPSKRLKIAEVVVPFDAIRKGLSTRKLRSRIVRKWEPAAEAIYFTVLHWSHRLKFIARRMSAVPLLDQWLRINCIDHVVYQANLIPVRLQCYVGAFPLIWTNGLSGWLSRCSTFWPRGEATCAGILRSPGGGSGTNYSSIIIRLWDTGKTSVHRISEIQYS